MNWPLEGSREIDEGIIISEPMDWCKSPTAIVPYRHYAYQREATNLADSVRQTDDRTHVKGSIILASYGDEPGVGGGVISGTHNAECTPKTWSESVTAEGRNVVRHDDEWWMNHNNTSGRLYYIKDPNQYSSPAPQTIDRKMLPPDADKYEAFVGADDAAEVSIGARILWGIGGFITSLGARYVIVNGVKVLIYTGSRASQKPDKCPCVVARYGTLQYVCSKACKDGQAHHIVPDFTKRWVVRKYGMGDRGRIKGLAKYYDGKAICLKGQKGDNGSEHYEAHGADSQIMALGDHADSPAFPKGTARIGDIKTATAAQVISVRNECTAEIEAGVAAEFAGVNGNTLGRTTIDKLPEGNALTALQNHYTSPTVH